MTSRGVRATLFAGLVLSIPKDASAATITGESAYAFNQRIGMNLHPDQNSGQWQNYAFVQAAMKALNIHWLRSSLTILPGPNNAYANFLQLLDADDSLGNIRSDLIVSPGVSIRQMRSFLSIWGVSYLEGPNEYDLSGNAAWAAADLAEALQLAQAPAIWGGITVVAPSLVSSDPKLIASNAYSYGNMHDYFGTRMPETIGWGGDTYGNGTFYGSEAYNLAAARRAAPGKPVMSTESGYQTNPGGLTEYTQAAYLERLIFVHAMNGVTKGFLYDLLDDREQFGLFHTDGSPKLSATGLQGLLNFLSDATPASASSPCTINATIAASAPVDSYLVCKNNGEKDLVLWQPVGTQDPVTLVPTPVTPATVTITAVSPGSTNYYAQSPNYTWLAKYNPTPLTVAITERPSIVAFNAQPLSLLPLPLP